MGELEAASVTGQDSPHYQGEVLTFKGSTGANKDVIVLKVSQVTLVFVCTL